VLIVLGLALTSANGAVNQPDSNFSGDTTVLSFDFGVKLVKSATVFLSNLPLRVVHDLVLHDLSGLPVLLQEEYCCDFDFDSYFDFGCFYSHSLHQSRLAIHPPRVHLCDSQGFVHHYLLGN